jgi:hypothetical protein
MDCTSSLSPSKSCTTLLRWSSWKSDSRNSRESRATEALQQFIRSLQRFIFSTSFSTSFRRRPLVHKAQPRGQLAPRRSTVRGGAGERCCHILRVAPSRHVSNICGGRSCLEWPLRLHRQRPRSEPSSGKGKRDRRMKQTISSLLVSVCGPSRSRCFLRAGALRHRQLTRSE